MGRALLKTEDRPTVKNQGGFDTCTGLWVLMPHSVHNAVMVFCWFSFSKARFHSVVVKHQPLLSSHSI